MPEYLSPGVYIEETHLRSKSILGVDTGVAGFVGPTRRQPADRTPQPLASFADFERAYGGLAPLDSAAGPIPNYVASIKSKSMTSSPGCSGLTLSRLIASPTRAFMSVMTMGRCQ